MFTGMLLALLTLQSSFSSFSFIPPSLSSCPATQPESLRSVSTPLGSVFFQRISVPSLYSQQGRCVYLGLVCHIKAYLGEDIILGKAVYCINNSFPKLIVELLLPWNCNSLVFTSYLFALNKLFRLWLQALHLISILPCPSHCLFPTQCNFLSSVPSGFPSC